MRKMLRSGFTLVELVIVIGILALLLAITIVAINPARQFAQANNTKRSSDVKEILDAIEQNMADSRGHMPAGIDTTLRTITNDTTVTNGVDLCSVLVPNYIAALPADPASNGGAAINNCTSTYNTRYTVLVNANNRLTVSAPSAENSTTISVSR